MNTHKVDRFVITGSGSEVDVDPLTCEADAADCIGEFANEIIKMRELLQRIDEHSQAYTGGSAEFTQALEDTYSYLQSLPK